MGQLFLTINTSLAAIKCQVNSIDHDHNTKDINIFWCNIAELNICVYL